MIINRRGLLCLLAAMPLAAQSTRGRSSRGGRPSGQTGSAAKDEPFPTFHGTFHSAAGGKLYLDTTDENQLEFWLTRKTVVFDGDKKLKLDDLQQGTRLSVEAKRVIATRMEAVTVRVEKPK